MSLKEEGASTNFTYWYQQSLSDAGVAKQRALDINSTGSCEADLAIMQVWFNASGEFGAGNKIQVHIDRAGDLGSNEGYQTGGNTYIQVAPFNPPASGQPAMAQCRAVFAEELAEVLMSYRAQQIGATTWDRVHSQGEALSHVCGALLHPDGYYWLDPTGNPVIGPAIWAWLNASPRPNWIDTIESTDQNDLSFGCGILFIYFLMYECDFTIGEIILAGGISFEDKFQSLTGFSGGWDFFSATVERWFPAKASSNSANYAPLSDDILPHPGRGPGLAALGKTLYAAWKGVSGDDSLYYSNGPDAVGIIPGNSSACPSLAAFTPAGQTRPKLFAGYKGQPGDMRVFVSSFDGQNWAQQIVLGSNSSIGPSLAVFQKKLYAAYKGEHSDQRAFVISTSDGTSWDTEQEITGIATSTGLALAAYTPPGHAEKLFGAFKGMWVDDRIFVSFMDAHGTWDQPKQVFTSAAESSIVLTSETSSSVALATLNDVLYLAYKGKDTEDIYVIASSNGVSWGGAKRVSGAMSSVGPSLTSFDGKLYLAHKGGGTDSTIYLLSSLDGANWIGEPTIPGGTSPDLAGSGTNQ